MAAAAARAGGGLEWRRRPRRQRRPWSPVPSDARRRRWLAPRNALGKTCPPPGARPPGSQAPPPGRLDQAPAASVPVPVAADRGVPGLRGTGRRGPRGSRRPPRPGPCSAQGLGSPSALRYPPPPGTDRPLGAVGGGGRASGAARLSPARQSPEAGSESGKGPRCLPTLPRPRAASARPGQLSVVARRPPAAPPGLLLPRGCCEHLAGGRPRGKTSSPACREV